jgi:hypothetical protein
MKAIFLPAAILPLMLASCGGSTKTISCINESGTSEFADGTIQQLTPQSLGNQVFKWFKDDGKIEVSSLSNGIETAKLVPATYVNGVLSFTARDSWNTRYIISKDGSMKSVLTGSSPDGDYVMRINSKCYGMN